MHLGSGPMKSLITSAIILAIIIVAALVATPTYSGRYSLDDYKQEMAEILKKDHKLSADDFKLWPEVALATRKLALSTSVKTANDAIDNIFRSEPARKLHSHAWSVLPSASILALGEHWHRLTLGVFRQGTKYPLIRHNLQEFVTREPNDPFVEFGYYALGDFDKGIAARPNSIVMDMLHYGAGFDTLRTIIADAHDYPAAHGKKHLRWIDKEFVVRNMVLINQHPDLYDNKPLGSLLPTFSERAAVVKKHFDLVLTRPKSAMADDAAYFLGWLAFHAEQYDQAAQYFALGMTIGNGDYAESGAVKQTVRYFERYPASRQYAILKSNKIFAQQSPLWYVAARSAYRSFDYPLSIEIAREALVRYGISTDTAPETTNPERIEAFLNRYKNLRQDGTAYTHVSELLYLSAASNEFQRYTAYLKTAGQQPADQVLIRVRPVILKYSQMLDADRTPDGGRAQTSTHKDLRQAAHLIDLALQALPPEQNFKKMREWLHYRKVKLLAVFEPNLIEQEVTIMENESPASKLNNNAIAEQIFAEAFVVGDMTAAKGTFDRLLSKYPNGNAVDNAHSWMAIGYRCAGQLANAQAMDREIIRRFPVTRHAVYAVARLASSDADLGKGCYYRQKDLDDETYEVQEQPPQPTEAKMEAPYRETMQFKSFYNVDIHGFDVSVVKQIGLSECVASCRENDNCNVYSYDKWNKTCFLKEVNGDTEFVVDPRSTIGLNDNATVPALSKKPLSIQRFRNRGFPPGDGTSSAVASYQDCETRCLQASSCFAFTFMKLTKECIMLRTTGEYFPNSDADSGAKVTSE